MKRFVPLVTFAATFALYFATMGHVHHGDSPIILEDVRNGLWFHPSHLFARASMAVAIAVTHLFDASVTPYAPAVLLAGTFGGALAAAAYHHLLRKLTGSEVIGMTTALALVVTASWWNVGTTLELHTLPAALGFFAAAALVGAVRSERPIRAAALAGVAQALASSFHLIATGMLLGGIGVLALQDRPLRTRAGAIVAYLASAGAAIASFYAFATLVSLRGLEITEESIRIKAVLPIGATPPPIITSGSAATDLLQGVRDSISSAPHGSSAETTGLVVVAIATLGALVLAPRIWRRHRGFALFPFLWLAGALALVVRVEPGNTEYFVAPFAAVGMLVALVVDEIARFRPGSVGPRAAYGTFALAFTGLLATSNYPRIASRMTSPTGDHVGRVNQPQQTPQLVDGWGNEVASDGTIKVAASTSSGNRPETGRSGDDGGPHGPPPAGGPPNPNPGGVSGAGESPAEGPRDDGGPHGPPPAGGPPNPNPRGGPNGGPSNAMNDASNAGGSGADGHKGPGVPDGDRPLHPPPPGR
jgi:hypothetical protein